MNCIELNSHHPKEFPVDSKYKSVIHIPKRDFLFELQNFFFLFIQIVYLKQAVGQNMIAKKN